MTVSFEWRCATTAIADQNISSRQNQAIGFEIDRTKATPRCVFQIYTETENEANQHAS